MRNRKSIEDNMQAGLLYEHPEEQPETFEQIVVELLLDIRDLLTPDKEVDQDSV